MKQWSEEDWQAQFQRLQAGDLPPPQCPECGRAGFFGPRYADGPRHYWLCKFCGFYRATEQPPRHCHPTAHGCPAWPQIAGASYVWWTQTDEASYRCPYCGEHVLVEHARVTRPVDDETHPWWRVPQDLGFQEAAAFWATQGQGRIYL